MSLEQPLVKHAALSFGKRHFIFAVALLLVYSNGSWLFFQFQFLKILLPLVLMAYVFVTLYKYNRIVYPNFIVLFLAISPILSKAVNFTYDTSIQNTLFSSIALLCLGFCSREFLYKILEKYAEIIYFLCWVAVIIGPITLIVPSFLHYFPSGTNDLFSGVYYNLIVYTDRGTEDFRVQSIFWEPGAWAFNQMFAFYWYVLIKKQSKCIPVFLIGMLITGSTTGFMMIALLFIHVLFFTDYKPAKVVFTMALAIGVVAILLLDMYIYIKFDIKLLDVLYVQTLDKLQGKGDSLDNRLEATRYAFDLFKRNPVFGLGRISGESYVYVTSTISELSYQLGALYTFVYIVCFRMIFNRMNFFLSALFVLIMLNGEAYGFYFMPFMVVIYGAKTLLARTGRVFDSSWVDHPADFQPVES